MLKKYTVPICILICFSVSQTLSAGSENTPGSPQEKIVFLHFNDFYDIEGHFGKGGLLPLSQKITEQKQNSPGAIITFGGDLLSPSLYSAVSKGRHLIEAMELLQVDIAVPGNHEFDFGLDNANRQFQSATFPWVISNLNSVDNSLSKSTVPTYVHEVNALKIGFLGLITPRLAVLSRSQSAIKVSGVIDTARRMVALLKQQDVALVVALTHLTLQEDKQLAHQVKGIDLILGGHDHYPASLLINDTLIFKAGYNGEYLGVIEVAVDRSGKHPPAILSAQLRATVPNTFSENKALTRYLDNYQQQLGKEKNKQLAMTLVELNARTTIVRSGESSFANLIADALKQHHKTDIALINGGAIRSDKIYPAGTPLSERDILSALPFANRVVVVKLSGRQLVDILEHGVAGVEHYSGRFPHTSGLYFEFLSGETAGQKVVKVMLADEPVKPEKIYTMATIDFLFQGGDGYEQFVQTEAVIGAEEGELLSNIVADYLSRLTQIDSVSMGRVKMLKGGEQ